MPAVPLIAAIATATGFGARTATPQYFTELNNLFRKFGPELHQLAREHFKLTTVESDVLKKDYDTKLHQRNKFARVFYSADTLANMKKMKAESENKYGRWEDKVALVMLAIGSRFSEAVAVSKYEVAPNESAKV